MEYLGFWVTRNGIRTIKKIRSHNKYDTTDKHKTVAIIHRHSKLLQIYVVQTITFTTPFNCTYVKNVKFKCTDVEQKLFDYIKRAVAHDTLLAYLNFSKWFDIHTYAINHQLGSVISKFFKPISFYSPKLTGPQMRYKVTEK